MQLALPVRRSRATIALVLAVAFVSACADSAPTAPVGPDGDVVFKRKAPAPTPTLPPPPPPTTPSPNPLADVAFYVNPASKAKLQADEWRLTRPADALQMDKIAAQPQARWIGNWNVDPRTDVDRFVTAAASANAILVLVAYNIPLRDCATGYSAGGANTPDGYRAWINAFAQGIGSRRAVVILEPDALAGMGCLTAEHQATRLQLISEAVQAFRALGNTSVYIDAGHSRWQSASTMATRLTQAGVGNAAGFALNVSNFHYTSDQVTYGNAISALAGGKHYVIDTSRNGLGSAGDDQWCNPENRALGERPTAATGQALVDAFLWVKIAGESDGACNGYPRSGTWMPEYALGLAQRAAY